MKRSLALILLVLLLIPTLLTGCKAEPQTFRVRDMRITLTDDFEESEDTDGFDACFESDDDLVLIQWLKYGEHLPDDINADTPIADCAEYVKQGLEEPNATIEYTESGIPYFFYEGEIWGFIDITFMVTIYKSDDALWIIQFVSTEDSIEDKLEEFISYADSVTFS